MMKRILCLALCLMLVVPAAMAETADTLPKRFVRQLSGGNGNGARGYISINASGIAEWLNMLMPFTAADIQIRALGEKQGEASDSVNDDDDWQVKFYVKDSQGKEAGTSWLYGDPQGVYFKSDMLPDMLLKMPVEKVHLLYQLFRGEFSDLFFAFDPMQLAAPGANGNTSAYKAVADLLAIPMEEWEAKWLPVLEKYFLQIDLWMAGFSESSILNEDAGGLTMSASYTIPADALKAEAKYIIGQMMYDTELQNLILPLVTREQRITYLNPQMQYFYEACIDALELTGDIVLSREMSALGEVVETAVELPLPKLPDRLVEDVSAGAKMFLELPYGDLLDGMNRICMTQKAKERSVTLFGEKRSIAIKAEASATDDGINTLAGTISITPVAGAEEAAYAAAFTCSYGHQIWQDEKYLDHDTTSFELSVEPDLDCQERGFQAVGFALKVDYRNNPIKQESPVQVNINVDAQLPDANVAVETVLRITTEMTMTELPKTSMQDASVMPDSEIEALLNQFVQNAMSTMTTLYEGDTGSENESVAAGSALPAVEPTSVPPVTE